jgi:GNAT superfamily N-acetyltransferase
MITVGVEKFSDCWDDIITLAKAHWEESMQWQHGHQPFNPSQERYESYERTGELVLFVVRDDGRYAGHGIMYLTPSMHTQALIATEDLMFLLPEYRNAGVGRALYEFVEETMWAMGAVEITVTSKPGSPSSKLLESLGCTLTDLVYSKHASRADSAYPPVAVTEKSDVLPRCSETS